LETSIDVPDFNDSFSRVVLDGIQYQIRFTWNDTAKRWSFGVYTMQKEPVVVGLRMIPHFPLNLQIVENNFPFGAFGVYANNPVIGRKDFVEGKARFAFRLTEV
jgi:hypothetical protein